MSSSIELMDEILEILRPSDTALDLGCGPGSFDYSQYAFRIVGVDLHLDPKELYKEAGRVHYIRSQADEIPLKNGSVNLVLCHHTLEHFPGYKSTLSEIGRVLGPEGVLWIAVPDGCSFDDTLFRHIFSGGGHVNQFRRDPLVAEVTERKRAELVQAVRLYSGFVYLKIPTPEQLIHFPETAEYLADIPERLSTLWITGVNLFTRVVDKVLGSETSLYGWGLVFSRGPVDIRPIKSCFNVCWNCGSGNAATDLETEDLISRRFGLPIYRCRGCHRQNFFVGPVPGTD